MPLLGGTLALHGAVGCRAENIQDTIAFSTFHIQGLYCSPAPGSVRMDRVHESEYGMETKAERCIDDSLRVTRFVFVVFEYCSAL